MTELWTEDRFPSPHTKLHHAASFFSGSGSFSRFISKPIFKPPYKITHEIIPTVFASRSIPSAPLLKNGCTNSEIGRASCRERGKIAGRRDAVKHRGNTEGWSRDGMSR